MNQPTNQSMNQNELILSRVACDNIDTTSMNQIVDPKRYETTYLLNYLALISTEYINCSMS